MTSEAQQGSARIELCEWASVNIDGTYTIVRGGLDHWAASLPLNLLVWALVEVSTELDGDSHPFELKVLSPDGMSVANAAGLVSFGSARRKMFSLPVQASVQTYGKWRVRFETGALNCEVTLDVRPPKAD